MPLRLSSTDYQNLVEVAHSAHDARQMHRAPALLWLHEGDTVDEVATRLFVTPRTVFRWRNRFYERQRLAVPARLADGPRRGRPKTVHGIIDTGFPGEYAKFCTVGQSASLLYDRHSH
jgi:hypothetical protein